ncbi:MAG: hypothetical protein AAGE94_15865, partial [Acidobacteriota bacterium]
LGDDDPVRQAVEYLLTDPIERRRAANAALAHAADRARHEPYAFDRLVVEWARRRTARQRARSLAAIDACVALFERRLFDPRRAGCARMQRAMVGLALAYRANDRRLSGHHVEAARDLARARRHLDPPTGAEVLPDDAVLREMRATILELRVDLASAQRDHPLETSLLVESGELLVGTAMSGRRAEWLWRQGRLDLALDHDDHAALVLERAAAELPDGLDLHLRLDILHLRAFAEAAVGSFERAAVILAEAEPLLDRWGHELMIAQRHHLLGHLAARADRHKEAETHWRRSYRLSIRHQRHLDAVQTLASLFRLWRRGGVEWVAKQDEVQELLDQLR